MARGPANSQHQCLRHVGDATVDSSAAVRPAGDSSCLSDPRQDQQKDLPAEPSQSVHLGEIVTHCCFRSRVKMVLP